MTTATPTKLEKEALKMAKGYTELAVATAYANCAQICNLLRSGSDNPDGWTAIRDKALHDAPEAILAHAKEVRQGMKRRSYWYWLEILFRRGAPPKGKRNE